MSKLHATIVQVLHPSAFPFPSLCMSSAFFIRKMYSVLVKYTVGVGRRTEGERT